MKHLSTAVLTIALLISTACNRSSSLEKSLEAITHYPVLLDGQQKWSLMALDGSLTLANHFDSAPSVVSEGYFSAYTHDGLSLYRLSPEGECRQVDNAAVLRYAGTMSGGRIPICRPRSAIEVLDNEAATIFSLTNLNGYNFNACASSYSDGLLTVRDADSDLWGAVNPDGDIVIRPAFAYLSRFNNGHALAIAPDESHSLLIVDTKGNGVEIPIPGATIRSDFFIYGHALIADPSAGTIVVDINGHTLDFSDIGIPLHLTPSGPIFLNPKGHVGLASWKGEILIAPQAGRGLLPVEGSTLIIAANPSTGSPLALLDSKGAKKADFPVGTAEVTPLYAGRGFWAMAPGGLYSFLAAPSLLPHGNLSIKTFSRNLSLSDIILSDRDQDHRLLNSADPGDDILEWMEPDKELPTPATSEQ